MSDGMHYYFYVNNGSVGSSASVDLSGYVKSSDLAFLDSWEF